MKEKYKMSTGNRLGSNKDRGKEENWKQRKLLEGIESLLMETKKNPPMRGLKIHVNFL